MTPQVQTVLGPVDPDRLGVTYPHEHLLTTPPAPVAEADPDLVLDRPAAAQSELAAFRAAGGRAVVELTTPDYGRDVVGLARLSERTGVHVVAASGYHKARYHRALAGGWTVDGLTTRFTREVTDEVDDTGIRCGVIKVATSFDTIEPTEELVIRAAARTHLATGCPITTHTEHGTMAEAQLDLLAEEGVDASAVVVGHLDFCADLDVHRRIAARGAFVELDQIPKPKHGLEGHAIDVIVALTREGHSGQLLVSGDLARQSNFAAWGGTPGLTYLLTTFRQRLTMELTRTGLNAGAVLEELFVANPQRAFAFRTR